MTTLWTRAVVDRIAPGVAHTTAVFGEREIARVPGLDLWDPAPVQDLNGDLVVHHGAELWVALSAPAAGDPGVRHHRSRLRLLERRPEGVRDCGNLFPDGASLGSSEWAACAILDPGTRRLRVLYTAAGRSGDAAASFAQRIAEATGTLETDLPGPRVVDWTSHREAVVADGRQYVRVTADAGEPGFIKAFRDPSWLRDPADGSEYLIFCASNALAASEFNGAVGIARAAADGSWVLLPPLLDADGVNNELERPHMIVRDGRYYLLFSTQARTFDPSVTGPTGLYGFVGPTVRGPWEPLNGSALIFRNPPEEPTQAYSWWVLPDLRAIGFADAYALHGRTPAEVAAEGPAVARRHFGGTFSPTLQIALDRSLARLVEST